MMADSDSDDDVGFLRPNGYVDVSVDNIDVSFGDKESDEPPAKKSRKGIKGKAAASRQTDDSPSPFADSSLVFEDSPAVLSIPNSPDPDPNPSPSLDDSCAVVEDENPLEDMCDRVRKRLAKEAEMSSRRMTRTSRRAAEAASRADPIVVDDDSLEQSFSVFDSSLNNQSSFSFDVSDVPVVLDDVDVDDPNEEVSIRVVWKGCNTKKFTVRKFQKIREIYTYYATLENVSEGRILFTLRDKPVSPNDTPKTLNIGVSSLEGGVIDEADVSAQGAQNGEAEAQEDPNALKLLVQRKGVREKHTVYTYPHEKVSVLISKLSEDLKIPASSIKLQFDGDNLAPNTLISEYDLENEECIDLLEK